MMKSFLKNVLANIVAILLIIGIGILFFVIFISFSIASGNEKQSLKRNTVLVLDEKTMIMDAPTQSMVSLFSGNQANEVLLYNAVQKIKEAKSDDKIKGISIELDNINAGITQLDNIRTAIEDFKKSGKFVYAYGNTVSQKAYYLGSVADKYFLNPVGGIELKGMSTEVVFLKNLAQKLGVGIEVIRHGKFKAAVEPFITDKISSENKEQLSLLLNDIWSNTASHIQKSRKLDNTAFKTTVDSLYGIIPKESLEHHLVDKLMQKSEYNKFIKSKLKLDENDKINTISLGNYVKNTSLEKSKNKDHIAILYAAGSVYNGKGFAGIYDETLIKEIQKLKENDHVKGVVLRVNSPGGSGNASDQILFELQQLKTKKPLVVSFGDYAASGGYYIAMAGEKIYSEPNTITGSIGVFGVIPNVKELAKRNGVRADVVKTNENSNHHSLVQGLSPGAKQMLTKSVEMTYKRFVHFVAENRHKSFEEINAVGGGRVWSGKRAKEIGLVDQLGTMQDAVAYLEKKVNVNHKNVITYPAKKSAFEMIFENLEEEQMTEKLLQRKIGKDYVKWFRYITEPQSQNEIMMSLPYHITIQ